MTRVVDGITYTLKSEPDHNGKWIGTWQGGPIGGDLREVNGRWRIVGTRLSESYATFEDVARAVQGRRKKAYENARQLVKDYEAQLAKLGRQE